MKGKGNIKKIILFFIFIIIIITGVLLYSRYIGTSGLKIKEYKIVNENFYNDYYGFKIVHISDIHYGRTTFDKDLKNLVKKINMVKPDIVVFTGDLIDQDTKVTNEQIDKISSILSKIDAEIGKFATNGNHDYYFKNWDLIIENSGFTNLNDKYELIYKEPDRYILLAGLSTNLYGKKQISEKLKPVNEYLKDNQENKPMYSILLMHEPDFIDDINSDDFDLVLSGHSHNGQVRMPFIGAIKQSLPIGCKKYYDEYYKIKNTDLYISSGIGTSTVSFRLFNRPSFNLYRITNK